MKKLLSVLLISLFVVVGFAGCGGSNAKIDNLSTYTINATFDDNTKTLSATQTVDYINNTDVVLDNLQFHLYPNAFRQDATHKPVSYANIPKAYPNGVDYGDIQIVDVVVNKQPTKHQITGQDQNILCVNLLEELYPDDSVQVYIAYQVKLPNIHHRFGYGDNTYNFGNFYPIVCVYEDGFVTKPYNYNGDPFYSDVANYNVKLQFSQEFDIAHSGEKITQSTKDNIKTLSIKANCVRDFAFVLSKKFSTITKQCGDTVVSYYYYNDNNANENLQLAVDSLTTFNKLFGKYPYKTLAVSQTNFVHGGMEYPNLVYISDQITNKQDYQNTIVHEIAHQWWYGLVGSNAFDNPWQDEGLTEFSTILFFENNPQYNINAKDTIKNTLASYMLFIDVYKSVGQTIDSSMNRPLDKYNSEMEYVYMTYVKGMIMFDDIRNTVGDKKFLKAMQYYFKQNCYKNATPQDLVSALNKKCGLDTESLIDSYLTGKVVIGNID